MQGHCLEAAGGPVPEAPLTAWRQRASGEVEQVIGQAEVFPVLASLRTWRSLLRNKRVVVFIDKDSARFSLIRRFSPVQVSMELIIDVVTEAARMSTCLWFERVPTLSNPADGPSRDDFSIVTAFGGVVVQPQLQPVPRDAAPRVGL